MSILAASLMAMIGLDTSPAERGLKQFDDKVKQTGAQGGQQLGPMRTALGGIDNAARIASGGILALGAAMGVGAIVGFGRQIAGSVMEMAEMADASNRVGDSFDTLAARAGTSSSQIMERLKQTSGGAISEYNLMLAANKAMMLGVADSADEMGKLMEIARVRGAAMGLSTSQAFDNLVTGLGRGSALILDNLGIMVDADAVNKAYAESLGKTVDALTEQEKKQALVNRTLEEATGKALPVASSYERMSAAMADMKVELGELFAPAVAGAADLIAKGIGMINDRIEEGKAAEKLEEFHAAQASVMQAFGYYRQQYEEELAQWQKAAESFQLIYPGKDVGEFQPKIGDQWFGELAQYWNVLEQQAIEYNEVAKAIGAPELDIELLKQAQMETTETTKATSGLADAQERLTGSVSEASQALIDQASKLNPVGHALDDYMGRLDGLMLKMASEVGPGAALAMFDKAESKVRATVAAFESMGWSQRQIGLVIQSMGEAEAAVWEKMANASDEAAKRLESYVERAAAARAAGVDSNRALWAAQNEVAQAVAAAGLSGEVATDIAARMAAQYGVLTSASMTSAGALYTQADAAEMVTQAGLAEVDALAAASAQADATAASMLGLSGLAIEAKNSTIALDQGLWSIAQGGLPAAEKAAIQTAGGFTYLTQQAREASAAMLQARIDAGESALQSIYTGAVGTLGAGPMMAQFEEMAAAREALVRDMERRGVSEVEAAFALAEFDAGVRANVNAQLDAVRAKERETKAAGGAASKLGDVAQKAGELSGKLQGMLDQVPGLTGTSEVTDEQMQLGAMGVPQNFADDYLRRLTDEVLNGVDWEGVDIGDAAARAGIDPSLPAETILALFKRAWGDSSLFANPENLDLINMDAVKASLQQQMAGETGVANIRALFGIGDEATVKAVGGLGLEVQEGLIDWLDENGMSDAGARLAQAIASGVSETGIDMGGGIDTWMGSQAAVDAAQRAGEWVGKEASKSAVIRPTIELPTLPSTTPNGGSAKPGGGDLPPVTKPPPRRGGLTGGLETPSTQVVINAQVAQPYDIALLAKEVGREIQRRQ